MDSSILRILGTTALLLLSTYVVWRLWEVFSGAEEEAEFDVDAILAEIEEARSQMPAPTYVITVRQEQPVEA